MGNLQAQGYRFIRRGKLFAWVHQLEMQAGDQDCTGMDDAEFERCVIEALGAA